MELLEEVRSTKHIELNKAAEDINGSLAFSKYLGIIMNNAQNNLDHEKQKKIITNAYFYDTKCN